MKINRASEFINYHQRTERYPGFVRSQSIKESGSDAVEISPEAHLKYQKRKTVEKLCTSLNITPDFINEIQKTIIQSDHDPSIRRVRLDELRNQITSGAYDFNSREKLSVISDIAILYSSAR